MKDYFKPNCIYVSKCKSKGLKCGNCKHNKNKKEDHYSLDIQPMRPYRLIYC